MDKIEEQIEAVATVLARWNPLGEQAALNDDLDGYRTEASDIVFDVDLRNANKVSQVTASVRAILNEAFPLSLSTSECGDAGREIHKILKQHP